MTLIWIGIGLGLALLALLVALLLYLEKRLYALRRRRRATANIKAKLVPPTKENPALNPSFIEGHKFSPPNFSHPNSAMMSRTRSGRSIPNGRRFGIVCDGGLAFTPLPPLVPPPAIQFEFQTEAAGKRHRDTFEAWKKGVVPPLKTENAFEKVDSDVTGTRGGKSANELTMGELGMSYVGNGGSGQEKALPKTPTPKTPIVELSGIDDTVSLDERKESGNENVDGRDLVERDESEEWPRVGFSRGEEDEGDVSALEDS
jgi:hypothetical protein